MHQCYPHFVGLSLHTSCCRQPSASECTAVAAIPLRMRMRMLTRPDNSLANYLPPNLKEKAANLALRRNSLANANVFANEM